MDFHSHLIPQPQVRHQMSRLQPTTPPTLDATGIVLCTLSSTLCCRDIDVPMDYTKILSANNDNTLRLAMYHPPIPRVLLPNVSEMFAPGRDEEANDSVL